MIGDKVRAARVRNLEAINEQRQRKLADRGVKETLQPPEDIAIPILEAAQGETRAELQDLWARLLANAMDPARANDVRPEFITTVHNLQPLDILIFEAFCKNEEKALTLADISSAAVGRRQTAIQISVEHLQRIGVSRSNGGFYALTTYGRELKAALAP